MMRRVIRRRRRVPPPPPFTELELWCTKVRKADSEEVMAWFDALPAEQRQAIANSDYGEMEVDTLDYDADEEDEG